MPCRRGLPTRVLVLLLLTLKSNPHFELLHPSLLMATAGGGTRSKDERERMRGIFSNSFSPRPLLSSPPDLIYFLTDPYIFLSWLLTRLNDRPHGLYAHALVRSITRTTCNKPLKPCAASNNPFFMQRSRGCICSYDLQ